MPIQEIRDRFIRRSRVAVLDNIAALVAEHGIDQDELVEHLRNYTTLPEKFQASRRKVDIRSSQREAGLRTALIREDKRVKALENWRTKREQIQETASTVNIDIPEITPQKSNATEETLFGDL